MTPDRNAVLRAVLPKIETASDFPSLRPIKNRTVRWALWYDGLKRGWYLTADILIDLGVPVGAPVVWRDTSGQLWREVRYELQPDKHLVDATTFRLSVVNLLVSCLRDDLKTAFGEIPFDSAVAA